MKRLLPRGVFVITFALFTLISGTVVECLGERVMNFDIPVQDASTGLMDFAKQSSRSIVFANFQVMGINTSKVSGTMKPSEALELLLNNTPLGFNLEDETGTFVIVRKASVEQNPFERPQSCNSDVSENEEPKHQETKQMNNKKNLIRKFLAGVLSVGIAITTPTFAQETGSDEDDVYELSPFVVDTASENGYAASNTLAGTRIRTDLKDVGSSISVMTSEFLRDVGGKNNETALVYALNTEVGGPRGNYSGGVPTNLREQGLFSNPNANTRVRGLSAADNTRNYYITDIPWDGYVVNRVDLQRGPNAILFGLGSPAGVINATLDEAFFNNSGQYEFEYDKYGSFRHSATYNRVILEDELAVMVAALDNRQKFQQKPAFSDDQRVYFAVKYQPKFMNSESTYFAITANFENGNIDSNRPRTLTPTDRVTRYWDPVSQGGLDGSITIDRWTDRVLIDSNLETHIDSITSFFDTGISYSPNSYGPYGWMADSYGEFGARNAQGQIIDRVNITGALWGSNPVTITDYADWARKTGQAYNEFYKERTLSDPSVFDFYNKLIDGPNKGEYTDWNVYEINLTNTFFHNTMGYNIGFFDQKLDRGQWGLLGWNNRILLDINETTADGTANPDLGRAYVQEQLRNLSGDTYSSDRTSLKFQIYGEYDFREHGDSWLRRILGKHRLTGLHSEDKRILDTRNRNLYGFTPEFASRFTAEKRYAGTPSPSWKYYLSDSLLGRSSAAGANLSNIGSRIVPQGGEITVRTFDTTWTAGGDVGFSDPWEDPNDYRTESYLIQAANPANYRGWTDQKTQLISVFDQGTVNGISYQDYLTQNARLSKETIESNVLVWQGNFWDDSIIFTYGYRKDSSRNYTVVADERLQNSRAARTDIVAANMDPSYYNLANSDADVFWLKTETKNWSVAVHTNRLLGKHDFLPFDLSLYYNEGENFQPAAGRLDAYAKPLPPPGGTTKEYSALIATKDGRYSLRATAYETVSNNQNTTGDIGSMWALEQAIFFPAAGRGEYRVGNWRIEDHPDPVRLETVILPAWDAFEIELKEKFPDFVNAWISGPWGPSGRPYETGAARPAGHVFTEDAVSEGLEFEFVANPTDHWRIALNVSKTEASRDNVPGKSFLDVAQFIDDKMMNTAVGEMPMWWPQSPGPRYLSYAFFRGDYLKLIALNGQSQGEVRKWRANLVTNYDFSEMIIEGLGAGFACRFEDKAIIDYAPMTNEDGTITIDLQQPYTAPSEKTVDLWLSYQRKLWKNVDWRIQLNVYNAFGDNELIPMSAQPDGSIAAWRIKEGMSWTLTNTFSF